MTATTTASCRARAARTASMRRTCSSTSTACIRSRCTWAPHIYTEWGWKNFQALDPRRLRQLPVHAERPRAPPADAPCGRESVPSVPAVHVRAEVARAEDGAAARHPAGVLRRERGRVRQSASATPTRPSATGRYFTADDKIEDLPRRRLGRRPDRRVRRAGASTCCPTCRPIPTQIEQKKIEVHYLGYYLKWHPQSCYYYAVEHGGFQASPERTPGTYSKYNSIDDRIDDFHYYTTYIKFGIGRATYDAAQEIRSRRHHARGGRGARPPLRRRVPRALRRGDLPLPEHPREGIPGGIQDVRAADHGPRSTSCSWPTASARRICGSSKTANGSCATRPGSTRRWARTMRSRSCRTFASSRGSTSRRRTSSRASTSRGCA